MQSHEMAVAVITADFLQDFFMERLDTLELLDTTLEDTTFLLNEPFVMNYTSVAVFEEGAPFVPSLGELDLLLSLAFEGDSLEAYISAINQLPDTNPMIPVTSVAFEAAATAQTRGASASNVVAIVSAGFAAFFLGLVGVMIFRRRQNQNAYDEAFDKLEQDVAHLTVSGGTFTGGSTICSNSEMQTLRQTRFSDEVHSINEGSEWNTASHLASDDGSLIDYNDRQEVIVEDHLDVSSPQEGTEQRQVPQESKASTIGRHEESMGTNPTNGNVGNLIKIFSSSVA